MSGGPVQLMAFGYGSAIGAEEEIMAELDALQGRGVLRLLDFLFVQKTESGSLNMLDIGDDDDYGTILSGFFPFDDDGVAQTSAEVDPDELAELADALAPGHAMALVLVEHLWAGGLFSAVDAFGGELLSEGFITEEGEIIVGAETEALAEAADVIEAAHAAETAARLSALQAIGDAAVAVEAAQQIREAAAAEAIQALIDAGLIEQAAAAEAADALVEAGVIIAGAEAAEQDAFDEASESIAASLDIETMAGAEAAESIMEAEALEGAAVAQAAASVVAADAISQGAADEADAAIGDAVRVELEAEDEAAAAIGGARAVERAEAEALAREVVIGEIEKDAARAEARSVSEAAFEQEAAAVVEAEQVTTDAGLREVAAIEEAEDTEALAARIEDAASLTKAEKRVLHYLGTDLTFALIADKLKISRGAVKDRAGRIYKKLGVHSREEAVDAAIELKLIKG